MKATFAFVIVVLQFCRSVLSGFVACCVPVCFTPCFCLFASGCLCLGASVVFVFVCLSCGWPVCVGFPVWVCCVPSDVYLCPTYLEKGGMRGICVLETYCYFNTIFILCLGLAGLARLRLFWPRVLPLPLVGGVPCYVCVCSCVSLFVVVSISPVDASWLVSYAACVAASLALALAVVIIVWASWLIRLRPLWLRILPLLFFGLLCFVCSFYLRFLCSPSFARLEPWEIWLPYEVQDLCHSMVSCGGPTEPSLAEPPRVADEGLWS